MPLAGIGLGLGTALAGGASAGASIVGAKMSSNASKKAAQAQVDASNRAAELQKESNDAALAFQQREAEEQRRIDEVNRRANYDQYVAQRRKLSAVGQALGLGGLEIPDYVPLYGGSNAPTVAQAGGRGGPAPALGETFDPAAAEAAYRGAYTNGQQFDQAYWAQKWPELVARGNQINYSSPVDGSKGGGAYARDRLIGWQGTGADAPNAGFFAGGGAAGPSRAPVGSVASYMPRRVAMPEATLTLPDPYRIRTVADYR